MRQWTVGKYIVTAEDEGIYLRDRHTVMVMSTVGGEVTLRIADYNGYNVYMTVQFDSSNRSMLFDITDIVRSYDIGGVINDMDVTCGGTVQAITYTIEGLTNPAYLPPHPLPVYGGDIAAIAMPTMMYHDLGNAFPQLSFECYGEITNGDYDYECIGADGVIIGTARQFLRTNPIGFGTEYLLAEYTQPQRLNLRPIECGKKYAVVQWQGRTGIKKSAVWELRQVSDEVTDTVQLLSMPTPLYVANTHPVDERRGYETHAVLHLDRLTAYDYWYYADIVTGSKVTVYAEAGGTPSANIVQVVTKSVTIPDSDVNAPYSLDIEIIFNKYDKI